MSGEGLSLTSLFELCGRLQASDMDYELGSATDEAVTIMIARPGGRWRIELHHDGTVEMQLMQDGAETASPRPSALQPKRWMRKEHLVASRPGRTGLQVIHQHAIRDLTDHLDDLVS